MVQRLQCCCFSAAHCLVVPNVTASQRFIVWESCCHNNNTGPVSPTSPPPAVLCLALFPPRAAILESMTVQLGLRCADRIVIPAWFKIICYFVQLLLWPATAFTGKSEPKVIVIFTKVATGNVSMKGQTIERSCGEVRSSYDSLLVSPYLLSNAMPPAPSFFHGQV